MTSSDDYPNDMSESIPHQRDGLDDTSIEALLGARSRARSAEFAEVAGVLTELRAVVDVRPPAPSSALAAMLEAGLPQLRQPSRDTAPAKSKSSGGRVRRAVLLAGLTSLVSVPVMGVAAAQDRLPDAAQHVVATVIKATTPFTVADPHVDPPASKKGPEIVPKQNSRSGKSPEVVSPADKNAQERGKDAPAVGPNIKKDKVDPTKPDLLPGPKASAPGTSNGNSPPSTRPTGGPPDHPAAGPTSEPIPTPSTAASSTGGASSATEPPPDAYATPAPSPLATSKTRSGNLVTPNPRATRARQGGQQSVATSEPSTSP